MQTTRNCRGCLREFMRRPSGHVACASLGRGDVPGAPLAIRGQAHARDWQLASSGCPSYEPELRQSGLGELVGDAVLELESGNIELRVDFAWTKMTGRGVLRGEPKDVSEVEVSRRRMSLRALMHFLFERAGFNRWMEPCDGR